MSVHENRNILLYWDEEIADPSVSSVVQKWQKTCDSWNIQVFSQKSAHLFLKEKYGADIASDFQSCLVPAMRSDFFRVFWALSTGGIYSDFTFVPKREPLFFNENKNITVSRWPHGRIVNGIFFAKKDSAELKLIAFEMLKSISLKTDNNIWSATGPGAWIRALGNEQTDGVEVVDRSYLFNEFLEGSGYTSSTRNTENHWSEVQKRTSIYMQQNMQGE